MKNKESIIGKSGVYSLVLDGITRYVGSASDFESRKSNHLAKLRKNKHEIANLQNIFNEVTEDKFEFVVLEFCKKSSLLEIEDYYQELYKDTIFNVNDVVKTKKKLRRGKEAANHKQKLSKINSGEGNPNAKLTENQAGEIIYLKNNTNMSKKDIAKKYNVSVPHIYRIGTKRWKGVNPVPVESNIS